MRGAKGIVLFEGDHCLIPVKQGDGLAWAKVDDDVAVWASGISWSLSDSRYLQGREGGQRVWLHQALLPVEADQLVDHANRDNLDNRRANLRPATCAQNSFNKEKTNKPVTSRWKGVAWYRDRMKWHASIKVAGSTRHLGDFVDEADAAMAYNEAALDLFGEFAALNEHPLNRIPAEDWTA